MDIIFIIFLLVVLVVGIVAAESNNWSFTTATVISTFVALELFFGVAVWATIVANPLTILLFTFIYIAVGAAYTAIWRWPVALRDRANDIQSSYDSYLANNKDHTKYDFMNSYVYAKYTASANKASLANWVLAWPLSLLWELARKPAIWVWNTTYDVLGNLFERVGKRVSANILKDKQ
jgi:uncharacterized membrane protein